MTVDLPATLRGEWRALGTKTERSRIALATIVAEIFRYEHGATADVLTALESNLGDRTIPIRSLFAIDVTLEPSLSSLGIDPATMLSMAAPKAKRQVVRFVEDEGIVVEGERQSVPFERDDGARGRWDVLEVSYPVDSALTADGPHEPPQTDERTIDAEVHVVVWPTADSYGVAGGTVPLETMPGLEGVLEIDPERDREAIVELVRSVEFSSADAAADDDASPDDSDSDESTPDDTGSGDGRRGGSSA